MFRAAKSERKKSVHLINCSINGSNIKASSLSDGTKLVTKRGHTESLTDSNLFIVCS